MLTEQQWINQMQKQLPGRHHHSFRSFPCFESIRGTMKRQVVYPQPVISAAFGMLNSITWSYYQIETSVRSGFCLEKLSIKGELNEKEFFLLLEVNHKIKAWVLYDDMMNSKDFERTRVGHLLYHAMRSFIEDHSPKRLVFLTEPYEEIGTLEEKKG